MMMVDFMMIRFAIEVQGKKKTTDREIRHLENEIEVQFSVNLSADRLLKVLL